MTYETGQNKIIFGLLQPNIPGKYNEEADKESRKIPGKR